MERDLEIEIEWGEGRKAERKYFADHISHFWKYYFVPEKIPMLNYHFEKKCAMSLAVKMQINTTSTLYSSSVYSKQFM